MAKKKEAPVRLRLKAGRKFTITKGEGDDRETVRVNPGETVELTPSQARNFIDLFEDPTASATSVELTPEEHAALERFREEKRKEAAAEQAKVAAGGDKGSQQVTDNASTDPPKEDKPVKVVVEDKPKK